MTNFPVTMDTARAALSHLDSTDRVLWVKMGQALKSEFGDDGFDLFEQWSGQASNYDAKAVKATWRGFKASGRVTIGSLIYEAKQRGFDPKAEASNAAAPELTAESRAARAEQRRIDDENTAAALLKAHNTAAIKAQALWDVAAIDANSPYLGIKGVAAHGVRFEVAGDDVTVLVPLRDNANRLWNVQRIKPDGTKLFMKSARVSGLYHLMGTVDAQGCLIGAVEPNGWLLVAEGYATAAALHEAVGGIVAVAFNAGNIKAACMALREQYPTVKILICADNDQETEQRTGKNAGIDAAQNAAALVSGCVVFPQGLPIDKSDFNDLANHPNHGGGVECVREQVNTAMSAFIRYADSAVDVAEVQYGANLLNETHSHFLPHTSSTDATSQAHTVRDKSGKFKPLDKGFSVNDDGVWYQGYTKNGSDFVLKPLLKLCSPLRVTANTYANESGGQGYLLEFVDMRGVAKKWVMPAHMLSGDGQAYRKELLDMGLRIGAGNEVRNKLTEYIQGVQTSEWVRCTGTVGWFNDAYVFPDSVIGNEESERVIFQSVAAMESQFKQKGTLEDWRLLVAAPCVGNSRLVFAVSAAFAGVLVEPSGVESAGFHLMGASRSGKSTALYAACSVFGSREYKKSWKATGTAMEAMAAQYNDSLLVLDEIGEVDGRIVGDVVYMLGNGTGKGRGNVGIGLRTTLKWRILYLSTGEKTLATLMNESGKAINAGQEARLINIPSNAGQGLGVFDTLNGYLSGHDLAQDFDEYTKEHYGVAGYRFITHVVHNIKDIRRALRGQVQALAKEWAGVGGGSIDGQVISVAMRFALVALAGEMATREGLTGWTDGEATRAAKACFDAWIIDRGGWGNSEAMAMLAQVRGWFVANGEARFTPWNRAVDARKPNTVNRAGFKRILKSGKDYEPLEDTKDIEDRYTAEPSNVLDYEVVFYVMPEVFKDEICKGFDHKAVAKLLFEHGIIERSKESYQKLKHLPLMGSTRCYQFTPKLFQD